MPLIMRALSVRQPWAWCLVRGKPIENRDWKSNNPALEQARQLLGKDIAVHASSWGRPGEVLAALLWLRQNRLVPDSLSPSDLHVGAGHVLGVARLAGWFTNEGDYEGATVQDAVVVRDLMLSKSPWADRSLVKLVFTDRRPLPRPVGPVHGALGFWPLPPDAEREVRANLAA